MINGKKQSRNRVPGNIFPKAKIFSLHTFPPKNKIIIVIIIVIIRSNLGFLKRKNEHLEA